MTRLVPITMFGWIPVAVALFALMPARRAIIAGYLIAWLFLPVASFEILGFPDYSKEFATNSGVLLGIVLFDLKHLAKLRPRLFDLPMLVWCVAPFGASIRNGLGAYDGLSAMLAQFVEWGVPYAIGRAYFKDLTSLRELAVGILVGGLLYVPLCLYEILKGPYLHLNLYGYLQSSLLHATRFGGWRPMVFMHAGLMVGFWMMSATLVGIWLSVTGTLRRVWIVPTIILVVITGLVKSVNGWLLLIAGTCILFAGKWVRTTIPLIALAVCIPLYVISRGTGLWTGDDIAQVIAGVSAEKAQTLGYRFENETLLVEKAQEQPIWGWGRWGRSRVYNEDYGETAVTDSLWIIAFGESGTVGLLGLWALLLLPTIVFVARYPPREWAIPDVAPAAVLAIILILYATDNLLNAMVNPIYMLAAGGLLSIPPASASADSTAAGRAQNTE